jgi:hypothetical protein
VVPLAEMAKPRTFAKCTTDIQGDAMSSPDPAAPIARNRNPASRARTTAGEWLSTLAVLAGLLGALAGCGAAGPALRAAPNSASSKAHADGRVTRPLLSAHGAVLATRDHFAGHAEPALAVSTRHPRILLGAAQFARPRSFTRVPGTFYSHDAGRTWHDNGALPLPSGYGYGDDVSAAFADGTGLVAAEIYRAHGSGGGVFVWRTTDNGRRFSRPVPVAVTTTHTDHPSLNVTTGRDGSLVVGVAWSLGRSLLFSRSTDGGRTFSPPKVISAGRDKHPDLAVVVPGPKSALSVVYADTTIEVTTSHDGGKTFTAPVTVPGAVATQGARPYEVSSIGAAANPRTGTLYVTFAEQAGRPARLRVVITRTRADGRWTTPTAVDPAADGTRRDQFQPSVAVTPQQEVYVTYFAAIAGRVNEYLTQPDRHSSARPLGSPFDPGNGLTVGVKHIPWLGDYQALASSAGRAYAAWNDGGTGKLQILVEPVTSVR